MTRLLRLTRTQPLTLSPQDKSSQTSFPIQWWQYSIIPTHFEVYLLFLSCIDGPFRDHNTDSCLRGLQDPTVTAEHAPGCCHDSVVLIYLSGGVKPEKCNYLKVLEVINIHKLGWLVDIVLYVHVNSHFRMVNYPNHTVPGHALQREITSIQCTFLSTFEPPRGKTNNVVSEQVRHKPACTSTEKSQKPEILDLGRRGSVLSVQRKQRR